MKTVLLSFLLVFITSTMCWSQSAVLPVLSLHKQLTLKRVTARAFIIPSGGIARGRNIFLIGPVVRIAQLDNVQPNWPLLTGVQLSQNYFLTKQENKKLQFFAEFTSKYQEVEEEWVSNYWSAARSRYIDYKVESEESLWENSLGAGMAWKFHRNLCLRSSLGIGYYLSFLQDEVEEFPDLLNNQNYRGYRNKGLFYSFQLGVAYEFPDVSKYLQSLTSKINPNRSHYHF